MKRSIFSSRLLDSRIRSEDTTKSEQILGYFLGPCLVYIMYTALAGTYLTQFYTDVLGLAGGFLTLMPLVSKVFSSLTGFVIGRMIDRTRSSQGKARPWILASGILLTLCGILLYCVPRASREIQILWVVVSYNLFFSLAFSVYSLSHSLMIPLSTRNTEQRDSLAMLTSTGTTILPGMLSTILMPVLIRNIGVGADAQNSWLTVMSLLSIIAIPATLIEYYFTKERVTMETKASGEEQKTISFGRQLRACLKDRYWVLIVLFTLTLYLGNGLSTSSMLYYCNWVLDDSVAGGAAKQILVNMIGQAPLGIGVLILWPMVRRFGKRKVTLAGFTIASLGSFAVLMGSGNLMAVLGGLLVKSLGSLPTYIMAALLAEALDHIELKNGFRADGFSASVTSIIQTLVMGLSQTILLWGIHSFGYIFPASATQTVIQPGSIRTFFIWCFAGAPMVCFLICAGIMVFYDLEGKQPQGKEP